MEIKGRTLTLVLISENKNIFIFFEKVLTIKQKCDIIISEARKEALV